MTMQKKLALTIVLVIVLASAVGAGAAFFPTATNQGYAPEQPIPFSHKIHAGDNKIDCRYCHVAAEKSRHATIPSMNVCMNCHSVVAGDKPNIQYLKKKYAEGKPIEWVRVHELPDFVYFPHNRHVAKGVACETCHGDVKKMDRVYQAQPLTMGWCLDCHRGNTTPKAVLETLAKANPDIMNPNNYYRPVAPTNCFTCHN